MIKRARKDSIAYKPRVNKNVYKKLFSYNEIK
jgi:hypothetical protein